MQWIKATERLPEKKGEENKVIVKGKHPKFPFVDYGFKNYSDTPNLYINLGSLSFLTTSGEGDFHSSYPIEYVEWLDESVSAPTVPGSVEKRAEQYAKIHCWQCRTGGDSYAQCTCHYLEDAYLAGATSQPSSPTEDVKEACKKYADEHADSKWNKAAELERAFLAGHAYKGQQGEETKHDEFITKHLAIIREKIIDGMIESHIVNKRHLLKGSMEHFLSGGNCNGLFRETILSMLNTAYNWRVSENEKELRELLQSQPANPNEDILVKALEQIQQMSDPGSYEKAIVDMKQLATEALLSYRTSAGEKQVDWDVVLTWAEKDGWVYNNGQWHQDGYKSRFSKEILELYKNRNK